MTFTDQVRAVIGRRFQELGYLVLPREDAADEADFALRAPAGRWFVWLLVEDELVRVWHHRGQSGEVQLCEPSALEIVEKLVAERAS